MSNRIQDNVIHFLGIILVYSIIFGACEAIDWIQQKSLENRINTHLKNINIDKIKNKIEDIDIKSQSIKMGTVAKGKTIAFYVDRYDNISLYYELNEELRKINLLANSISECQSIYIQVDYEKYLGEFQYTETGRKTLPTRVTHRWSAECFIDPVSYELLYKNGSNDESVNSVFTSPGRPEEISGRTIFYEEAFNNIVKVIN